MTFEVRLLFYMVARTILPKKNMREFPSDDCIELLYQMISGRKVPIGAYVFESMEMLKLLRSPKNSHPFLILTF